MLSEKPWTKAASIGEFLVPKNSAQQLRKVDNQICRVPADDYYQLSRQSASANCWRATRAAPRGDRRARHRLRRQPAVASPQPSRLEAARLRHRAERDRRRPRDRRALWPVRTGSRSTGSTSPTVPTQAIPRSRTRSSSPISASSKFLMTCARWWTTSSRRSRSASSTSSRRQSS